jgi:hypothetical protein
VLRGRAAGDAGSGCIAARMRPGLLALKITALWYIVGCGWFIWPDQVTPLSFALRLLLKFRISARKYNLVPSFGVH